MKIYIASHCQQLAKQAKIQLEDAGYDINSRWLLHSFEPTATYTEKERREIAKMDLDDVAECDALVLLASQFGKVTGGKFVEAGYALGLGREVYVIGHRENMLLWAAEVQRFDTVADLVRHLAKR